MAEFLNFHGDYTGISSEAAEKNLDMYGENVLRESADKSFKSYRIILNPIVIILALSAVTEAVLLQSWLSALVCALLAAAAAVLIGVYTRRCNERIAERTAATRMKYRVIRNSQLELIPAELLVPDDIIIVQSGETVPADAHILEASGLFADESRFTGDSTPKEKHAGADTKNTELKTSCIYAGSRITSGGAVARVTATGEDTYRARKDENKEKLPDPNFSRYEKICEKVKLPISLIGIGICAVGLLLSVLLDKSADPAVQSMRFAGWLLCILPPFAELFIRLYNVDGITRIKEKGAAVKSLSVLEQLNALTTVVIDKSAVVAPNMLEVAGVYSKNNSLMTTVTVLACERENTMLTEQAFLLNAALGGTDIESVRANELIEQFHYNDTDRMGGNIYRIGGQFLLCIKGSVEKIISLCDMDTDMLFDIQQRSAALAKRGLEVWASAYRIIDDGEELPKSLYSVKYTYMGLVSFMSATRDMIPLAVQGCRRAGVKLVLTSSDSPETAASMGRKIGLKCEGMITGDDMREAVLLGETLDYSSAEIFSHITAAQKLEVIDRLREAGETVAAIGHTDADFETLCHCDLGITSLENTTGCIYDASGLIVGEDNFAGIVEIIKESRQLHRNIKKCLSMCISALAAFLPVVLADMIFSLGIITPMFGALFAAAVVPLCAMSFCQNTADLKSEMSSSGFIGRGKINKRFFANAVLSGGVIGLLAAICGAVCAGIMPALQTSAVIFVQLTLSLCALALISADKKTGILHLIRSGSIKRAAFVSLLLTAVVSVLLVYIPFINGAFGFDMPNPAAVLCAVLLAAVSVAGGEIKKHL